MSVIEQHRIMLNDPVRLSAYQRAIEAVVRPGDVVLDLGAGSGILTLMALKAGARFVHAVEAGEIATVLAQVLARNNVAEKVAIHAVPSNQLRLQTPVDVLITETLGSYPLEENIIEYCADALTRLTRPGGSCVPRGISISVAPLELPTIQERLTLWQRPVAGFDVSPGLAYALNNMYVETIPVSAQITAAAVIDTIALARKGRSRRRNQVSFRPLGSAFFTGLGLWWELDLAPGIMLSTAPDQPATHWQQLYLPLATSVEVRRGDEIAVTLHSDTSAYGAIGVAWDIEVIRDRRRHCLQRLSTDLGWPPPYEAKSARTKRGRHD